MKGPAKENELARKSKEMNGHLPSMYDNVDYGKKRKAKNHKFSVKDTKNGKTYWTPAIAEHEKLSLIEFLAENSDIKQLDKLTMLPELVMSELRKLITQGAKDVTQQWQNSLELVNTAYHVANIRRPNPDQRGAWKQYEDLLRYGVHALSDARGNVGSWRESDVMYNEDLIIPDSLINEQISSHRFFVSIPNEMDVELEGKDMNEIIRDLVNKFRRHGARLEVAHRTREGAVLTVYREDEPVEEIVIKDISS
jgi:hypothetical protein